MTANPYSNKKTNKMCIFITSNFSHFILIFPKNTKTRIVCNWPKGLVLNYITKGGDEGYTWVLCHGIKPMIKLLPERGSSN